MIMRHIPSRTNKYYCKCHISKYVIFGNKIKENGYLNSTEILLDGEWSLGEITYPEKNLD